MPLALLELRSVNVPPIGGLACENRSAEEQHLFAIRTRQTSLVKSIYTMRVTPSNVALAPVSAAMRGASSSAGPRTRRSRANSRTEVLPQTLALPVDLRHSKKQLNRIGSNAVDNAIAEFRQLPREGRVAEFSRTSGGNLGDFVFRARLPAPDGTPGTGYLCEVVLQYRKSERPIRNKSLSFYEIVGMRGTRVDDDHAQVFELGVMANANIPRTASGCQASAEVRIPLPADIKGKRKREPQTKPEESRPPKQPRLDNDSDSSDDEDARFGAEFETNEARVFRNVARQTLLFSGVDHCLVTDTTSDLMTANLEWHLKPVGEPLSLTNATGAILGFNLKLQSLAEQNSKRLVTTSELFSNLEARKEDIWLRHPYIVVVPQFTYGVPLRNIRQALYEAGISSQTRNEISQDTERVDGAYCDVYGEELLPDVRGLVEFVIYYILAAYRKTLRDAEVKEYFVLMSRGKFSSMFRKLLDSKGQEQLRRLFRSEEGKNSLFMEALSYPEDRMVFKEPYCDLVMDPDDFEKKKTILKQFRGPMLRDWLNSIINSKRDLMSPPEGCAHSYSMGAYGVDKKTGCVLMEFCGGVFYSFIIPFNNLLMRVTLQAYLNASRHNPELKPPEVEESERDMLFMKCNAFSQVDHAWLVLRSDDTVREFLIFANRAIEDLKKCKECDVPYPEAVWEKLSQFDGLVRDFETRRCAWTKDKLLTPSRNLKKLLTFRGLDDIIDALERDEAPEDSFQAAANLVEYVSDCEKNESVIPDGVMQGILRFQDAVYQLEQLEHWPEDLVETKKKLLESVHELRAALWLADMPQVDA